MGGFFGCAKKTQCVTDLFYGTDYNSHLATNPAPMDTYDSHLSFVRSNHSLEK